MAVTSRGVAVFCGAILATVALFGLLVDPDGPWREDFMLASWLPPIVLFPGAALAGALGSRPSDRFRDLTRVLWPAYAGLALYGLVVGHWWFYNVSHIPIVVTAVHAVAFILAGGLLAPFAKTRPAALQIVIGYLILLVHVGHRRILYRVFRLTTFLERSSAHPRATRDRR